MARKKATPEKRTCDCQYEGYCRRNCGCSHPHTQMFRVRTQGGGWGVKELCVVCWRNAVGPGVLVSRGEGLYAEGLQTLGGNDG